MKQKTDVNHQSHIEDEYHQALNQLYTLAYS